MNLARLCARLKPVFLPKKGPSRARLLTKMSPSEELGTLNPRKTSPVFQGQLTTWGEKSLPGGNSPPLLYIALWGVEIPPPLTELSHGRGGEFTPPLYLVLWGMEIPPGGSITRETKRSPGEIRFYTTKLSLSTNSSFPICPPKTSSQHSDIQIFDWSFFWFLTGIHYISEKCQHGPMLNSWSG